MKMRRLAPFVLAAALAIPASSQDEEHHARREWLHEYRVFQCGQLGGLMSVESTWADQGTQDVLAQEWKVLGCEAIQKRVDEGLNRFSGDEGGEEDK